MLAAFTAGFTRTCTFSQHPCSGIFRGCSGIFGSNLRPPVVEFLTRVAEFLRVVWRNFCFQIRRFTNIDLDALTKSSNPLIVQPMA
jgi:hypothetical protein